MPQIVAYPLGGPQADFKYFFRRLLYQRIYLKCVFLRLKSFFFSINVAVQMHYNNPNKVQGKS